jgi:hypothetical protein
LQQKKKKHYISTIVFQRGHIMLEESLTSLAILKVNWDHNGDDYVQNFLPFLAEALRRAPQDHVSVPQIQDIMKDGFGLIIPQGAINTLLRRAQRQGFVRRESGVFMRNVDALPSNFGREREQVARQQRALVQKLIDFSKNRHAIEWSQEQGEEALLAHLQKSCVPILAAAVDGCPIPLPQERVENSDYIVSSFVVDIAEKDPEGFTFLETVMKGHMLVSALFLPDISKVNRRFKDIEVYIDTQILLRALGLEGESLKEPYVELLTLLFEMNVNLACFDITVDEIRRILDAAVFALKDPQHQQRAGYFSVYEHFVSQGTRASDVELIIANLIKSLNRLHIHVREHPKHTAIEGLNEARLAQVIKDEMPNQREDAQHHDIDCLTAIHRLRKGQPVSEIERCKYLFVTTNSALARASAKFFIEEYGRLAVPVCVSDHTMATLAWVKKPTYAESFSRSRLIADSYAALQPNQELWRKYSDEILRLRNNQSITNEDYHVLRFSTVARNALLDTTLGSPDAFTTGTIPEILEAAKANARRETETQLEQERKNVADAERKATEATAKLEIRTKRFDDRLDEIGYWLGNIVGKCIYAILFCIFFIGFYATLPGITPTVSDNVRIAIQAAIVIFFLIATWSVAEGGHIRALARKVEVWMARKFKVLMNRLFSLTE